MQSKSITKANNAWRALDRVMGSSWTARTLFAGGSLCFLLIAYWPGGMNVDSFDQYSQALQGQYRDWHPPVMAALWSILLRLGNGPGPMLCFHLGMLFCACALLSTDRRNDGTVRWLWLVVPILPWIIGIAGMIWKDLGMAFSFFLGFALFHKGLRCANRLAAFLLLAAALSFFLYGVLVRANAIFAAMPVCYYLIRIALPQLSAKLAFGSACLLVLFLVGFTFLINDGVLQADRSHPTRLMRIDEIAATSHMAQENLFSPASPVHSLPYEELPRYQVEKGWDFYPRIALSDTELKTNWLDVMTTFPWSYFKAKWRLFGRFNSLPFRRKGDSFHVGIDENTYGISFTGNSATNVIKKYVKIVTLLRFPFLPVFWIPLALWLFWTERRQTDRTGYEIKLLTGSALCYYLGFMLVTPTPDYRFLYWTFLATTAAAFLRCYTFRQRVR